MATLKSAPSPGPGTLKFQTWVLKVPIHCQGCQKKVKKVLQSIDGVYVTTVDAQQHKVTVTGNVTSQILIKKLIKSGKHAELWPNSTPKITNNNNNNNSQKKEKNNSSNNKQAGGAKLANNKEDEEESAKEQKDPKQKAAKDPAVDKPPAEGPNPKKKKKDQEHHPGPGGSGSHSGAPQKMMMIESLDHNQSRPYPGLYAYPPYPPPMYYGPPPLHNHNLHGVNYPPVVYHAHTPQLLHNAHPPFHGFHKDHDDHGNGDEEDCGCSVM